MFTKNDLARFTTKGISQEQVINQIELFKKGFPFAKLQAAAVVGNGILRFNPQEVDERKAYFEANAGKYHLLKFVPASGAASRMFKHLFEFRALLDKHAAGELLGKPEHKAVKEFFEQIESFAFYPELEKILSECRAPIAQLIEEGKHALVLDYLLGEPGLNYAKLPKALLLFHKYEDGNRMAMEEHLVEGAVYARSGDEVHIHFTVSPEHEQLFEELIKAVLPKYIKRFGVNYTITFSEQKSSTDTIAVDMDNKPFRDADGCIVFRPGGHGALIENLNDLDSDIVFIKNIDNVVPDALREPTYHYKKVIGGLLMEIQSKVFTYLEVLEKDAANAGELQAMIDYARQTLMIRFDDAFDALPDKQKIAILKSKLNRPMRVCGMVKNEGEPGGGPFWVQTNKGLSLQIVESSQIDLSNPAQKAIFEASTHFNPVDLVCGLKNYKGQKFHLPDYVDHDAGFISIKSKEGRELKAMELPGLWNGAMADWITVFVEVPIETFNPVKTVNDLLRSQHQA
jgi:hypothetical protein